MDDDLELCHVVVDILNDKGFSASFVQTAEEALERVSADPFDLILLDLEIPHMGGFILCQRLRGDTRTKDIPLIFLSVRDSDFDKRTAMSLGANLYITKPFRRSQLLKEVARLMQVEAGDWIMPGKPKEGESVQTEESAATTAAAVAQESSPGMNGGGGVKGAAATVAAKLNYWFKYHKAMSIGVSFVVCVGLMWGGVGLYRKISDIKNKDKGEKQAVEGEVSVNVMQIQPAPFQDMLTAVGTIVGGAEVELRFQTEGNIRTMKYKEGDAVRAGQVIAMLDQRQAQLRLDRAESELSRYEKLFALGGVSKDRLEEARVQVSYAKGELDKTVLTASQDGILGDKASEVGEFVTPQKKVYTLVSLESVLVRLGVIEKEIDKILPGQNVLATVDTYPNVEFKGKVENISPLVQGQSKTLTVEARIPNENKLLLPGMFARTKIIIYEQDNVITVPNDALEKKEQGYQVFVVGPENKAEARQVEVGYVSVTHSVVTRGLLPGDQVVIQKPQELKAGSPLKIVDIEKQGKEGEESTPAGMPPGMSSPQ